MHTQIIYVAAELGIADLLKEGRQSVTYLASATSTIESRLYRVLRALASIEIFVEAEPGYFENTPLAEPLRSDSPNSMREFAVMMGAHWHASGWANILHCVRNDESAFRGIFQKDIFEHFRAHPKDAADFDHAMTFTSRKQISAVCQAYDFSSARTIVDVGGGHGYLLTRILEAYPALSGILLDRPEVASMARSWIKDQNLDSRCQVMEGSFFDEIPQGGDIYILKYIIHDWDDEEAVRILTNCRNAMTPGSKLLVIDAVVPTSNPSFGKTWADIEMMVMLPNGRERTEAELGMLLKEANLRLNRIVPMRSELSIAECTA